MNTRLLLVSFFGALAELVACSSNSSTSAPPSSVSTDASADAAPVDPPIACGADLPGPKLPSSAIEAKAGYEEALNAVDVTAVPDPFDYSKEDKILQAIINYMLVRSETAPLAHKDAKEGMARAVLAAAAKGTGGTVDEVFLRQGFFHFYLCSQSLPTSLAALSAKYGDYKSWTREDLPCGRPKDGPRTLWENSEQGVFVAETVTDAGVREVEALFTKTRKDGQLDFAVYEPTGETSNRSTFATAGGGKVVAAAPITCMACHFDNTTNTYSKLRPTGTGAGCR